MPRKNVRSRFGITKSSSLVGVGVLTWCCILIRLSERQKVVRKLNQSKKRLSLSSGSSKTQLEVTLSDLRVDLNYILVR